RREGARIVIETNRIVKASSFGRHFAEASHPFRAVVKPPGWPQAQRRIDACQWCQFSRIGCLIQCEEYDSQVGLEAYRIQKRLQCAYVIGTAGNVETHISTVTGEHRW